MIPQLPLALALACTAEPLVAEAIALQAELSLVVPTVPTVHGSAGGAAAAWVLAGRDGAEELRVALELDGSGAFEQPVLGLKAGSDYRLWLETADGRTTEPVQVQTGSPPSDLAAFTVDPLDPDRTNGGYLVTGAVVPPYCLILDRDGDLVWWYHAEGEELPGRCRLSRDGERMWMVPLNVDFLEDTELRSVTLDGSEEQRLPSPLAHHDFVERADGSLAVLTYDPREIDGEIQEGDAIVEVAADGSRRTVYSMWDFHDFDQDPASDTPWPHANALDLVEEDDDYLVSLLFLGGIARVDRSTGDEEWFLGGPASSFRSPEGRQILLDYQHGMDLEEDRLMVFVNGKSVQASSVIELELDPASGTATETWSYWPEPALYNPTMGDVQRLPGGNVLATFSFNGVIQELTAEGQVVWQLSSYLTGSLSYTTWVERLQPAELP